jgi:hypothetical protein
MEMDNCLHTVNQLKTYTDGHMEHVLMKENIVIAKQLLIKMR